MDSSNLSANSSSERHLFDMPDELLVSLFLNLAPTEMTQVELVCRRLNRLMETVYQDWYGQMYLHRTRGESSWKSMALEQETHVRERDLTPEKAMNCLLEEWYTSSNGHLAWLSQNILLDLRQNIEPSSAFYEAVATAYMAQGRVAEARDLYNKIESYGALPEKTWLTAARFSWEVASILPDNPQPAIRLQAIFGAVLGGNLVAVQRLSDMGPNFRTKFHGETLALTAARVGEVDVLQYLYDHGVDESVEALLSEAAASGCVDVVEFLMNLGAEPSSEDLRIAIEQGHVDVARSLVKRRPSFKAGRLANDELVLASVFSGFCDARATLCTLVADIGIDVNARGKDGESIVHIAASKGYQTTIELLEQLGADMSIKDKSEQTPLDMAISFAQNDVAEWLKALFKTSSIPSRAQQEA